MQHHGESLNSGEIYVVSLCSEKATSPPPKNNLLSNVKLFEKFKIFNDYFSMSETVYMTSGGVPGEDFDMENSILRVPGLKS